MTGETPLLPLALLRNSVPKLLTTSALALPLSNSPEPLGYLSTRTLGSRSKRTSSKSAPRWRSKTFNLRDRDFQPPRTL